MMDNKKKAIISLIVVILTLLVLVIGASYAYFSVTSTNSFGSKTISASAPNIGSVQLIGDNSTVSLNLSAGDMMRKSGDVIYYGTANGTPSSSETIVKVAHTNVTGEGYFNCSYTLNVTATGTNNLYTAFQGWSGKSTGQIVLQIANKDYDFYTSNLFPITINETLNGVTSADSKSIGISLYLSNKRGTDQSVLKSKDITITVTATNFNCSLADGPYYYVYDSTKSSNNYISEPLSSSAGLDHYLVGDNAGNYAKVCGVFNGTEFCMSPGEWINNETYKSTLESLGASCYLNTQTFFYCRNSTVNCGANKSGTVGCGYDDGGNGCNISKNNTLCFDYWDGV